MTSRDRKRVKERMAKARRRLLEALHAYYLLLDDFKDTHPEYLEHFGQLGDMCVLSVQHIERLWIEMFGTLPKDWHTYSG